MKPLKGKGVREGDCVDSQDDTVFRKQDVASAVEWMKKSLHEKLPMSCGYYKGNMKDVINTIIDEAFEDVQGNRRKVKMKQIKGDV